jgi:dimethylargininase
VLRLGKTLLVGRSPRTNDAGIRALEAIVRPFGYRVTPIEVRGCLHLKTACTALDDETLLLSPRWLKPQTLTGYRLVEVDEHEPWAANVLRVGTCLCISAATTEPPARSRPTGSRSARSTSPSSPRPRPAPRA